MTSVKEFRVHEPATAGDLGRGAFVFTDDYSVFDWGKMPDEIPGKGASLCTMGAFNFEALEREGVTTHYEGVVTDATDGAVSLDAALDAGAAPREMAIELAQVPELPFEGEDTEDPSGYDYEAYHAAAGENYLVPLEIVFRNRVPVGSSLRKRTDPADHGLEFEGWPDEAVDLADPVVEFSTKYEEQDRYLSRAAADRIAGRADVDALESVAREVNRIVTERAEAADLVHEDGKIECLYYEGELRVADVVGAVSAAKREADERGVADWKSLCDRQPGPLDESVITAARDLYCAGTNAYVGRDVFDAPFLAAAVDAVRDL
ncbi:phosphoribosylaminoimidazolesuccinocarboxamide synthase [Halobacteriales archaeon QH_1_68_42]|nr:MAG: phosphoribosylaminoimidazolesuccinocarboxamide synthase [Halobacteriales archaeon QH_1_68_42]